VTDNNPQIVPVILSGGGGTRLWPMSRPERPKQFLALVGPHTMFEMTLARVADANRFDRPIIVANAAHADLVEAQLSRPCQIILEPCARNTAPAIALAALAAPDPASPLLILPSDHAIADEAAFHRAIETALPLVRDGWLATFGISPTGPETGYGYIQLGETIGKGVHAVERFVEKPDVARATGMIADGHHVWNGGIFLFRADAFLAALRTHAPEILDAAERAYVAATHVGDRIHPDPAAFAISPSDSIDYAVMEKAVRVAVVPVSMGWSDVGSWDALHELGHELGHELEDSGAGSNILAIDTRNSLLRSDGIRIHIVGVSDLIVVASGNDVLIVPRGKSQNVSQIVAALKQDKR
jgi:mannose-1-phosphate guanylyltransferase